MAFELPNLPYDYDALAPYMSRETLEYHHDKHHLAYVNNGNNLLKGTEWENKSLEEVVKGSHGKNAGLFNNAGQHYNHIHFWKWMKPGGGGDKIPGALKAKIDAGATRAVSQFFFDIDAFLRFRDRVRAAGIEVPLIPGVMPVTNFAGLKRMSAACGAAVPCWLAAHFDGLDDDPETRRLIAVSVAAEMCELI